MITSDPIFAPGYKAAPYWWERSPRPDKALNPLPEKVDVAVIGSGFTGMNAAIQTARAGRHTLVLDAEAAGHGCSTRNGGQISTSIKGTYRSLARKHGEKLAFEILKEGDRALDWLEAFVLAEGIDCDFKRCGRFHAAHNRSQFEALSRELVEEPKGLETDAYLVSREEQSQEIGSELYHGGVVKPRHAALDPGRYHQGLLERAMRAGAELVSHCRVEKITGRQGEFVLHTPRGRLKARDVIVATNGYTTSLTPWNQRRVIPIGSYIIATEPLSPALMQELIPKDRVMTDTRKLVVYYRACPERKRILFGGRVSINETDPTVAARPLHAEMVRRFKQLHATRISHAWMGFVAYTFDEMPHLGQHDGLYYSMGYCGSGVSLASYFGCKIGLQVIGDSEGASVLSELPFSSRPYYFGRPWFLAPSIYYYRWADERGVGRSQR